MSLENILIKNIIIDYDRQKMIRTMTAYATASVTLYKNTNYVFRATVIHSVVNNDLFGFQGGDIFAFAFGNIYGAEANPVVVTDADFNNSADWSLVDPTTGKLCWRVDTSGTALATDMGNASSKKYIMNLWCFNSNLESVLICAGDITVQNVINYPP